MLNCQKSTDDAADNRAEMIRSEIGQLIWKCSICGYCCPFKSRFEQHYRIHTGEKPFACHLCPYRCNKNSNLKVHLKMKHKEWC